MRHNVAPLRVRGPAVIHRWRLAAFDELPADVAGRVVDAEQGLALIERTGEPAPIRLCRGGLGGRRGAA